MMKLNLTPVMIFIAGLVLGLLLYHWFLKPEITTEYFETIVVETDTTNSYYKEKYKVDSIKSVSLSDSIDYYKLKYQTILKDRNIIIVPESEFKDKPIIAPLRRFNGEQSFLYGNTYFQAIVAGELLDMEITNDFKIPTITNTIERTKTITNTINRRGLFGGINGNSNLGIGPTVQYLNNKSIFTYNLDLTNEVHTVSITRKIF